jgi:SAM-dependent methyltransferase
MSGFMNPAEFANIANSEKDFWWYRGMRSILFRMIDPHLKARRIRRALEAGCGTGYFSRILQSERGLPVYPIDIGWEGLRFARSMGVERATQANALNLPFADAAFDAVLSIDVLPHFGRGDEQRAVSELGRVLAPGGLLVIRTAALNLLRSRHSEFVYERQRYSRGQLLELARKAGIRVLRCTYANSILFPVALAKFRIWEPLTRQAPASGVEHVSPWLDRILHRALEAEASWIGAGHGFPIGQSLILIGEKIG